ncbi:Globin-related protein [Trichinella spiralis]|uniref:Globin-related protein n=1 Tax=Trichinella spiralis TaxID=6334 RepID=A0ABR3KYF6_TRISP
MNRQIPLRSVADKATLIRLQFLAEQLQCQKLKKAIWRESSDLELLVICKSPGTRASRLAGLISFQLPTIKRASIGISKSSGEVDTSEPNSQSRQSFNMTEVIRSDKRVTKSRVKFLTKSQRQNVVRSWEKVPNKRALGEEIYIQIFMHKPMLKSLFPFRTVPVDQLRNNALFTRQAAIFADFIDCVVGYLAIDNGNLIMELSERVGVNHALMTSVNFDPEWWVLFANSVLDCIRQYCEPQFICLPISRHITRKIMIAWRILLKEVVDRMSEAFIQRRELDIRQENNCDPNAQLVESEEKQNHSEDDDLNNPNLEIFDVQL